MKSRPKLRLATACLAFVSMVGSFVGPASTARAAGADSDTTPNDARLDTFGEKNVTYSDSGVAKYWLALILLGIVGLAGMFKDAKRSHLD